MFGFFDICENKEFIEVLKTDDKERFLPMLSAHADEITMDVVANCALFHARRCLLAMIEGEGCEPALQLYARTAPDYPVPIPTPLATVTYFFHEAYDIVNLLLKLGASVDHANIKCNAHRGDPLSMCPLEYLLFHASYIPHMGSSWDHCTSVIKVIILLCQWDTKSLLDCARLLAPHTNGLNDIAWSYVTEGNLVSLAALLLVAHEKVLLPFDSGLTIEQRIRNAAGILRSSNLDHDGAAYQYMLTDACKLIDIFKRAGVALSLYSLMHEYVPPHKVLADVASVLKGAGYAVEPRDIDLRDCYRACPELKRASVFKLSSPRPNYHYPPPSLGQPQGFGAAIQNYPYRGNCALLNKLKSSRPVLSFRPDAFEPQLRLLSTAAVHVENGVSGILQKQMAYIAFRLKRGIKF